MKKIVLALFSVLILACTDQPTNDNEGDKAPKSGEWLGVIALNDSVDLPFNFNLHTTESGDFLISIYNGDEEIKTTVSSIGRDSIKIEMPVFANYIVARFGAEEMTGFYINPDAENYQLSFEAAFGDSSRFETTQEKCCDINKKWAVQFSPDTENESPAIAYFEQIGNTVKGTFATETGDYRFLEGVLSYDNLKLSAFDGAHLFVFEAQVKNGQTIEGLFYSGRSFMEPWVAYRDDNFELRNADSLTFLKEGFSAVEFTFDDLKGNVLSLSDERFKGKPVIIQIMGSWCPNCMDETRYLNQVYDQYHEQGLEIVGLTFERAKNEEIALLRASKMVADLQIEYPVLLAGATRKDKAGDLLPMLNHIMSFPTAIYLNADHTVRKIHTGFSGPGTPLYENFTAKDKSVIEEILKTQSEE